jgi:phosphopantothenoylcysteine synthetase/decarboxylase
MSENALEFVETWVEEKIEEMDAPPADVEARARTLAAECVAAAQEEGITKAEIKDAFDDLAAFIAGEIEEAVERENRSDEGADLVSEDDARLDEDDDDDDDEEDDDEDEDDEDEDDKGA